MNDIEISFCIGYVTATIIYAIIEFIIIKLDKKEKYKWIKENENENSK